MCVLQRIGTAHVMSCARLMAAGVLVPLCASFVSITAVKNTAWLPATYYLGECLLNLTMFKLEIANGAKSLKGTVCKFCCQRSLIQNNKKVVA